jgi:hypothetical protein
VIARAVVEPNKTNCSDHAKPNQSVGYTFRDGVPSNFRTFPGCAMSIQIASPNEYFEAKVLRTMTLGAGESTGAIGYQLELRRRQNETIMARY